ncbi:MAG: protein kinase domain-containing protein [Aquimonas sp.]
MTAGPEDPTTRALDSEPRRDGAATSLPESIGPFRILGLLGEGGMGRVYRALERTPPREVALKVAGLPTRAALERFEREIELLAQLEHPGIARLYATGVDANSGLPWLSMELVPGEDLGRWAARVQPDREAILQVLLSMCAAVQYAHGRGVLHRDLKPSNVFVTPDGSTRVLDFGIARLLQPTGGIDPTLTVAGQILGTLPYMAPEQLAGEPVDARGDVYALGVIAYELLGGQLPYPRLRTASAFEALDIVRAGDPPPLASLSRRAQGDLGEVVMKAIAPEPERRYGSVDALAADLRAVMESRPVSARPPTPAYLVSRFVKRHRALSAAVASIVLVLLLATAVSVHFAVSATAARETAEARAMEAEQLNDFMTGMMVAARPSEAQGKELVVSDLLHSAEAELRQAELPERVRVRLLLTLAETRLGLGQFATALELLTTAQDSPELTNDPALKGALLRMKTTVLTDLGRYQEAESTGRDAKATLEGLDAHAALAVDLTLARLLSEQRRYADAEVAYRSILEVASRLPEDSGDQLLRIRDTARSDLATSLREQGKVELSLELTRELLAERESRLGGSHPLTLISRQKLALALLATGAAADAERELNETLNAQTRVLGAEHADALNTRLVLADALITQRKLEQAETLNDETLQMASATLGAAHPQSIQALSTGAYLAGERGDIDAAEAAYRGIVGALSASDPAHPEALIPRNNLAMFLLEAGRVEDACKELTSLGSDVLKLQGDRSPLFLIFRSNEAECLIARGDRMAARDILQRILPVMSDVFGEGHDRTTKARERLARADSNSDRE